MSYLLSKWLTKLLSIEDPGNEYEKLQVEIKTNKLFSSSGKPLSDI